MQRAFLLAKSPGFPLNDETRHAEVIISFARRMEINIHMLMCTNLH